MKKILLFIALSLTTQITKAQADAFITTWVTTTGFETITLSAQVDAPNYTINWGDGFSNTYTATQVPSHTFVTSGEHTVSFTGTFPHLTFSGQTKLKAVQQWGTQKWTSMANMFKFCSTFNSFPNEAPDLSLCAYMSGMFVGASAFNQPIGAWNVSNVTDMSSMFQNANVFNQPIESWNVSSVTSMTSMFVNASAFNQPIGAWNVSSVINMNSMFINAFAFNQPIGSWNVKKATFMSHMFSNTPAFNQPIDSWDVSNVTNMSYMFSYGSAFNQTIGSWNVSSVTDMSYMFVDNKFFNQSIGSWNVSNVTNMSDMFGYVNYGSSFNQPIGSWNVSSVTNMSNMFKGSKLSTANYDATLIGWATKGTNGMVLKPNVNFAGGSSNYCNASDARNYLINTYGWVITDDGLNCTSLDTEVVIGTQTWTNKNLDVETYSDGTLIPQVTNQTEWANLTTGAWCYYNNDSANSTTYGKLYNWFAVAGIWNEASKTNATQRKRLASSGYHVPSDAEWTTLTTYLGGESIAGGKMKETSTTHWASPNTEATNSFGFTGVPSGYRDGNYLFHAIGVSLDMWSSSDVGLVWTRTLRHNTGEIFRTKYNKIDGYSVRCVKDNALSNKKFEDNTFKIYPNPAINTITVDCGNLSNLANQPFVIMDALGKIILKGKLNEGGTTINVENLFKGVYFIKVANDKASKFIKE